VFISYISMVKYEVVLKINSSLRYNDRHLQHTILCLNFIQWSQTKFHQNSYTEPKTFFEVQTLPYFYTKKIMVKIVWYGMYLTIIPKFNNNHQYKS
jgi:hypothetical protein